MNCKETTSWGEFEILLETDYYKVKQNNYHNIL